MNYLSINSVSRIGREAPLFTNVTFGINQGDKIALIGRNGCGKSTLLSCIAGVLPPTEGTIVRNQNIGVSYLSQNPEYNPEHTITEHIFKSESPKLSIIKEYEATCDALETADNKQQKKLQQQLDLLTQEMTDKDLWNYENDVRSILHILGIADMSGQMKSLSGGMLKKVALAQVLVEDSQLLLLDEPTNHLDITTIGWLEEYLRNTDKSVLMVTHDRYFLDTVCNNIYELDRQRIKLYQGNYSTYLEKKEIEAEIEANTDRRIESVLRTERDWLMRGPCARGTKARARVDNIHRMINREKFQKEKGFSFEVAGRRLGGKILELEHISKNYPKGNSVSTKEVTPVLDNFSYVFNKGEKIGIFGDNGTGKSTLLNIITGNLSPDSGTIVKGENTVIAYYNQNPTFENTNLTVLEYIKEAAEVILMNNGKTLSASQLLEQFGFEGKIQYSTVSTLSGGERKRLYLVRLLMNNPNFLVLDEPTNDFDIFTMSILESFLEGYKGCLLVVSHDRYFMDKVADTLFILENDGSVSGYVGKCSQYIEERKEQQIEEKRGEDKKKADREAEKQKNASGARAQEKEQDLERKRTFKEQKEFEKIEEEIFEMESRKEELESLLAGGEKDRTKLANHGKEYNELQPLLENKYSRWEELGLLKDF